ncbi:MAG TPA: anti-sigma factor [Pseudomonadota bacterium]|nr:anti-sigma factor [Pseudomonadota bacterium]
MNDDHIIGSHDGATLAAEYVLGVLGAAERREFEQRMTIEPALRTEVEYWEQRLGGLAFEVKPIDPPPQHWANIEAALNRSEASPALRAGLWNSLTFWRWAAIGSAAVAAASMAALVIVDRAPSPGAPLVAKLDVSGGQAGFVAAIDPARNGLTIIPASVTNVNQRVLELWLIAPGEKPRSLGLIEAGRPVHINLPSELIQRIAADATLAVSLEPPGGSPTGLPTGPVIANGKLTNL